MPVPHGPGKKKLYLRITLAVIAVIVIFWVWSFIASGLAWRAIFLTNNQVYFGHFWDTPFASTITLHDVYYLQVQSGQDLTGGDESAMKLVKLGNEIHGPTDEMVIPIQQVLFWETLRSNSAIVTTINNGQTQSQ